MTAPICEIVGVTKAFGDTQILRGVDLQVHPGEVVCIIGPSGSGKTTLLRAINHLEKIDSGRIYVDGKLVGYREHLGRPHEISGRAAARSRLDVGMVFQRFNLFHHLTVLQNLTIGPVRVKREPRAEAEAAARRLLGQVGLADRESAYPRELSGGQQQRVAIARALAMRPKLMLFDEPTSALDAELVSEVLDVIRDLANSGMTMIIVTHEIRFARTVADKLVFMDGGVIVEAGPPEELLSNPNQARTRAFLSRIG